MQDLRSIAGFLPQNLPGPRADLEVWIAQEFFPSRQVEGAALDPPALDGVEQRGDTVSMAEQRIQDFDSDGGAKTVPARDQLLTDFFPIKRRKRLKGGFQQRGVRLRGKQFPEDRDHLFKRSARQRIDCHRAPLRGKPGVQRLSRSQSNKFAELQMPGQASGRRLHFVGPARQGAFQQAIGGRDFQPHRSRDL